MSWRIIEGDCRKRLRELPAGSARCCVTSPPYFGLRDYGVDGQVGLETTPTEYVDGLVGVFREVRRVLADDGTLWLNLGDSYAGGWGAQGHRESSRAISRDSIANQPKRASRTGTIVAGTGLKPKDLIGVPWMAALALRADGWHLRCDVVWSKPNPKPENVSDRPSRTHEYLFLLSKRRRYYYDDRGVLADRRSVWEIAAQPFRAAHFATFPPRLVEPCVLAGSAPGDTVLDPFSGAATTGVVAVKHGREFIGIELKAAYADLGRQRLGDPDATLRMLAGDAADSAQLGLLGALAGVGG